MNSEQSLLNEITEFVVLALEGDISSEQHQHLDILLQTKPLARKYYFQLMNTHMGMHESDNLRVLHNEANEAPYDIELWKALEQDRLQKFLSNVVEPESIPVGSAPKIIEVVRQYPKPGAVFKIFGAIAAMVTFAFILNMLAQYGQSISGIPIVARLTDQVEAKWAGDLPVYTGSVLRAKTMTLEKGLAKVVFEDGAEVVLEGPAQFNLESASSMKLLYGKLYARVSPRATGFTVKTPSSTIIDIGTEFGVEAKESGSSFLHMYKGRATLIAGNAAKAKVSQTVLAGQAIKVDDVTGKTSFIALDEYSFVRSDRFEILSKVDKGSEYDKWLLYCYNLHENFSLTAYSDFEKLANSTGKDTADALAGLGWKGIAGDVSIVDIWKQNAVLLKGVAGEKPTLFRTFGNAEKGKLTYRWSEQKHWYDNTQISIRNGDKILFLVHHTRGYSARVEGTQNKDFSDFEGIADVRNEPGGKMEIAWDATVGTFAVLLTDATGNQQFREAKFKENGIIPDRVCIQLGAVTSESEAHKSRAFYLLDVKVETP